MSRPEIAARCGARQELNRASNYCRLTPFLRRRVGARRTKSGQQGGVCAPNDRRYGAPCPEPRRLTTSADGGSRGPSSPFRHCILYGSSCPVLPTFDGRKQATASGGNRQLSTIAWIAAVGHDLGLRLTGSLIIKIC